MSHLLPGGRRVTPSQPTMAPPPPINMVLCATPYSVPDAEESKKGMDEEKGEKEREGERERESERKRERERQRERETKREKMREGKRVTGRDKKK